MKIRDRNFFKGRKNIENLILNRLLYWLFNKNTLYWKWKKGKKKIWLYCKNKKKNKNGYLSIETLALKTKKV